MAERVAVPEVLEDFYNRETEKIVDILKEANPVKIIRFGSIDRGEPHAESDLDLCVLMDWPEDRPAFRVVQSLYRLLSKHQYSYPVDIQLMVYRPAEFYELLERGNYFVEEIAAGEVVYEHG